MPANKATKTTKSSSNLYPHRPTMKMVAVDVLQMPMSLQSNKYLLVVKDYFNKWAEAIPMPYQTAMCIN